jgi:hypothetical protein
VADNGVFVNSDNDTADFENFNETSHGRNGSRDNDSGKAYWRDGLLLSSMTNFKVKMFFIKSDGTGFKADSKIIRYFDFF